MLTGKFLLLSESFANDYMSRVEHFTNPANASKIDDFLRQHFESKIAATKDIYSFDGKDAHIMVNGPMSPSGPDLFDIFYGFGGVSYADILDAIAQAKEDVDPSFGTLFFIANTPGGTVDMVDEVYQAIKNCGLKTVMINTGMLASGGMWIGSACDEIVASTPVAFAGSIGVVVSAFDISGMLEKMGVKRVVITNHEATEKIADISTEEGQQIIREELNAIYSVFKSRFIGGRSGKINEKTIDELKGSVKVATEAVSLGLMDAIWGDPLSGQGQAKNKTRAKAKAEPASHGEEAMDLEKLKADHPELVAEIAAEATKGMIKEDDLSTKIAAAKQDGSDQERQRIQDVEAQSVKGQETLIATLKYDGKTTGPEAAVQVLQAVKADQSRHLQDLRADAPEPLEPSGDAAGPASQPSGTVEERAKAQWDKSPELRDEFGGNFESFVAYKKGQESGRGKRLGQ